MSFSGYGKGRMQIRHPVAFSKWATSYTAHLRKEAYVNNVSILWVFATLAHLWIDRGVCTWEMTYEDKASYGSSLPLSFVALFHTRATNSFPAKEPLITGLFCGKWPMKMRHPMGLRYLYHSWLSLWRKMTYKDKARDLPTECCSVRCAKYQKTAPYVHWLIGG